MQRPRHPTIHATPQLLPAPWPGTRHERPREKPEPPDPTPDPRTVLQPPARVPVPWGRAHAARLHHGPAPGAFAPPAASAPCRTAGLTRASRVPGDEAFATHAPARLPPVRPCPHPALPGHGLFAASGPCAHGAAALYARLRQIVRAPRHLADEGAAGPGQPRAVRHRQAW